MPLVSVAPGLSASARALALDAIDLLPPALTVPLYFRFRTGRWPQNPPRTFSHKVQALKMRPVTAEMVDLADKVAVKDLVRERLGPEWLVPTLYVGPGLPPLADRNWPLPFVLKASHGSGWNIFVRETPDWSAIEDRLDGWLRTRIRRFRGELHYRQMRPQVIVEPMIAGDRPPIDYKVFVFDGRARIIQVDTGRHDNHLRAHYDRDWQRLPFRRGYPDDPRELPPPSSLPRILEAAERMAAGHDFLRVDFYDVAGRPYFGEVTFFPGSGTEPITPVEYERVLGDMWPWPEKRGPGSSGLRSPGRSIPWSS